MTPLAETLGAMQEPSTKAVRRFPLSNVGADLIREAAASGVTVVAVQNHYSLAHRDDDAEVLPLCRELGIGYVPYFPLGSGLLTGKYWRGEPAPEGSRLSGERPATRSSTSPRRWRSSRPSGAAPCSSSRWARLPDPRGRFGDRGRDEP